MNNFSTKDSVIFFLFIGAAAFISLFSGLSLLYKNKSKIETNSSSTNDYVYIDIPDRQKSAFTDLIRGFEHFAKIRAYTISFSYDSSFQNKIGFKFYSNIETSQSSTDKIKSDFEDYLERIRSGRGFNDLPQMISFEEHQKELLILKNKIVDLEFQYKVEKNLREYFEKTANKFLRIKDSFKTHSFVIVQIGENNSVQTIQPDHAKNLIIGDKGSIDDYSKIFISKSYSERKKQIDKIEEITKAIEEQIEDNHKFKGEILSCLKIMGEELELKEQPSRTILFKQLLALKSFFEKVIFTHDLKEALTWLFNSFKF